MADPVETGLLVVFAWMLVCLLQRVVVCTALLVQGPPEAPLRLKVALGVPAVEAYIYLRRLLRLALEVPSGSLLARYLAPRQLEAMRAYTRGLSCSYVVVLAAALAEAAWV